MEILFRYNEWKPFEDFEVLKKHSFRGGVHTVTEYLSRWMSLDTETAHDHDDENPHGWIYQWAFKLGNSVVGGRRPSELMECLRQISDFYALGENRKMVIFVHNLSYDIVYLKEWLKEYFEGDRAYLAIRPHKYIEVRCGGFILRCTYKLSNKSLAAWARDMGCEHQKIAEKGDYYDEIHYQDEELGADAWRYQFADVLTLDECVERQLSAYGDTVVSVPLTSTGYVRRECRRRYKKDRKNRKRFVMTRLCVESYALARAAFRGGMTHGFRKYAGVTVVPEREKGEFIRHRDFRSHYPSQQRTRTFPVGRFVLWKRNAGLDDLEGVVRENCCLMWVTFENVEIREKRTPFPYIPFDKAFRGRLTKLDYVLDNGSVLKCDGIFRLALTELDLKWILKQYNIVSYRIDELWIAKRGYLPAFMRETIDEYFYKKTALKKEEKQAEQSGDRERWINSHMELLKSKNILNGIYGMTATDPVREECTHDENDKWTVTTPDIGEALDNYYEKETSFNRYQWGIWTTACARDELLTYVELIQCAGGTPLYCDTDSLFYLSNESVEKAIESENARRKAVAIEKGAFIEHEEKIVNYDSFDDEGEYINGFRFLHCKCYAYDSKEKGFRCVIAGVSEFEDNTHDFSREDELGGIDELADGKTFVRCGGTMSKYVHENIMEYGHGGHVVEMASSCIILPTTKTLSSQTKLLEKMWEWEKR